MIDLEGVFGARVIKMDVIPFARAFGFCAVKPCTTVPIKAPIGGPLRINWVCEFYSDKAVYTFSHKQTKSRDFADGTKSWFIDLVSLSAEVMQTIHNTSELNQLAKINEALYLI